MNLDGWSVHQCTFGHTVVSVIMIDYSEVIFDISVRLDGVCGALKLESGTEIKSSAAYVDVSINGILERGSFGGQVPCRSIWDKEGRRLAAVIVLNSLA